MINGSEFFDLSDELRQMSGDISETASRSNAIAMKLNETNVDVEELTSEVAQLASAAGLGVFLPEVKHELLEASFDDLNLQFDELLKAAQYEVTHSVPRLPKLSKMDMMFASGSGLVAALIDAFLIGIPHKGNAKETGSPLTDLLRKFGNNDGQLTPALKWLENKCEVPYDLSGVKNLAYSKNHRIRSFGHDPVLGLLFAIFDCMFRTCTIIDNLGKIQIIPRDTEPMPLLQSVIFYIGHLLSDVCTSAGLPIPGWCLTQLFAKEAKSGLSLARVAEELYKEGYDLRHLVSMSTSVGIGRLILGLYMRLQYGKPEQTCETLIYERELDELQIRLKNEKMLLIMNSVGSAGNLLKFLMPPASGNPAAINLPQWISMLNSSINTARAAARDRSAELAVANRETIDSVWKELLE